MTDLIAKFEYLGRSGTQEIIKRIKNLLPSNGKVGQILGIDKDNKIAWIDRTSAIIASNLGDTFEECLNAALAYSKETGRTTIDMTNFTGEHECEKRFVIDSPVTILLGDAKIIMKDSIFFHIKSNNVIIEGINKQTDKNSDFDNATTLILKGVSDKSEEGYHIYSRGVKNCQYRNMILRGTQSSVLGQYDNSTYPLNGTGGIYIEKENPGMTSSGNTVNATVLENLLITGTKAHAIYMDTPILSNIKNVRISDAGGHGIYINGGTSTYIESVYISSANLAGFCLQGITYCTVVNSVAEYCSLGWWVRSCFNVSLFSPGVESTTYVSATNLQNAYNAKSSNKRYGKGLYTTDSSGYLVKINDIPDESYSLNNANVHIRQFFNGTAFLVTGGKNINIYSPYAKSISSVQGSGTLNYTYLSDLAIIGNARSVIVNNFDNQETSSSNLSKSLVHEVIIGPETSSVDLSFDPSNSILTGWTDFITDVFTQVAPIYNECDNALIHNGRHFYTSVIVPDIDIENGTPGQVLTKTENGVEWKNNTTPELTAEEVLAMFNK